MASSKAEDYQELVFRIKYLLDMHLILSVDELKELRVLSTRLSSMCADAIFEAGRK